MLATNKSEVLRSLTLCGRRRTTVHTCTSLSMFSVYVKHTFLFLCFLSLFIFVQSLRALSLSAVICCCRKELTIVHIITSVR